MPTPAAPITPGFYAGIDGRVFLNALEMPITKWGGDYMCPMSDRTNALSGGFQQGTRTNKSFNGQFSCVVPDNATGDPEFEVGNTYPLYLIAHDGRGYSFPAYIETISPSSETTGDLGYDVKFKSNGNIIPWTNVDLTTLPTGVVGQGTAASGTV